MIEATLAFSVATFLVVALMFRMFVMALRGFREQMREKLLVDKARIAELSTNLDAAIVELEECGIGTTFVMGTDNREHIEFWDLDESQEMPN